MFRRSPSLLLKVVVLTGVALQTAAAQNLPDVQSWLSRPISPGTVAYLVNYPLSDPLIGRLAAALRDPRSDVRAAAARVAFVLGANGLATVAGEALKTESDVGAAIEQARIVAYFSDSDPLLLDAWTRLGADAGAEVLFALAGARGVSSLRLLPQVRAAGVREGTIASFIRLATHGDRSSTLAVASSALEQRDSALFAAVLTSAPNAAPYADELAMIGLAPGVPRDITFKTMWYVVYTWNAVRSVPARVKNGLEQALNSGLTPGDPTELLALELAAHIVGRPSGATPGWNDLVARPPSTIKSFVNQNAVRALLNDRELGSILKGLQMDLGPLQRPTQAHLLDPATAPNPVANPPMRVASGFPVGFMSDVFRVTGCNVADAKKNGPGEAVLTFRPDGRPMHVALASTKASRECADAVRVLMIAHVESVDRIPPEQARVLTLFDTDFVACQDVPITRPQQVEGGGADSRIQQPRKIRHVPPVYPQSAIDQRLQGVVLIDSTIAPNGCIARAEVTRSLDPRLDWASLSAVTGWRFTPTLLNNTPVPVVTTVTVQFSLK